MLVFNKNFFYQRATEKIKSYDFLICNQIYLFFCITRFTSILIFTRISKKCLKVGFKVLLCSGSLIFWQIVIISKTNIVMHVPFCLNVFVPYSRMRALNLIIPSLFYNEGLQLNYSFLVLDRYFSCFKLGFLSHKCYREGILKSQKRRYATAPPPESVRGVA